MSISWMIDLPCSKFLATCRPALLILFLLLFILSKFPCVGSTPCQDFLGRMSDQIILAVEKTEARYCRSFLMFFINLPCLIVTRSFPPTWTRIITGEGLNIIASWNLGIRSRQCILLVPSQWTFLFANPRFDDALKAALSDRWEISESPMNQISVRGYIIRIHKVISVNLHALTICNNFVFHNWYKSYTFRFAQPPPSFWIHFMFCFFEIHMHCATYWNPYYCVTFPEIHVYCFTYQ